ncbi:uncharacterized protein B0H64DRAFT_194860 [Chaetomium fimeti]|uniref:Uncharacterized protein n=1 Tax=Chaetomium fimeti TaxID=1854472 RepID=A0AAE0LRG3_9PEZI|nr:hypothetical protein B0H64DRAFT_194860 [Chaetomium fimeti]
MGDDEPRHFHTPSTSATWDEGGSSGPGVEETEANEGGLACPLANQKNAGVGFLIPTAHWAASLWATLNLRIFPWLPNLVFLRVSTVSTLRDQVSQRTLSCDVYKSDASWIPRTRDGTQVFLSVAPYEETIPTIHARVRAIPSKLSSATADHLARQRLMVMKCALNQGQNLAAGQREHWLGGWCERVHTCSTSLYTVMRRHGYLV